jgi:hypothetical protein
MRGKCHYSVTVKNHRTGVKMRVELVDVPFMERTYRLRVNGRAAEKVPFASKSRVLALVRRWLVAQ